MRFCKRSLLLVSTFMFISFVGYSSAMKGLLSGRVTADDGSPVEFATVFLEGTGLAVTTDEKGNFGLKAPAGDYVAVVKMVGFETASLSVKIIAGEKQRLNVLLKSIAELGEVEVLESKIDKIGNSAFNATAVSTKELSNTTKSLSEALAKAPGMKIRESGGLGSNLSVMMDGFSGKHVKVFIDGIPQEGAGSSLGLNNIPVNFAERIEIYRGVVPVGFGSDAIGGVINVVTSKNLRRRFVDASYSYGSFNTHKSYVNFGQTFSRGFKYEVNAFQNYSDNDYMVESPVEDFSTGAINRNKKERVKRFNDRFHNEAIVGKVGFIRRSWADKMLFGLIYSRVYKAIQTGVRQEIVYGKKHRHGYSLIPSFEFGKREFLVSGLDVSLSVNYNRNVSTNVDTASVKYNWRGETAPLNSPGEQSLQLSKAVNHNWSGSFTAFYRISERHIITFNNVFNSFKRVNEDLLSGTPSRDEFTKVTTKNISGISYKFTPHKSLNFSLFGKLYHQGVSGPIAQTSAQDVYRLTSRKDYYLGYGIAGTWFIPYGFQLKVSYEKAYRLPTIEEMFGDEDLEMGDIGLKPESSHNMNLNLSYSGSLGKGTVFAECGLVFRDTRDYIQRNIMSLGGGKQGATYVNYGKVATSGYNVSLHYSYSRWLTLGGNITHMNVRDNMPTAMGSSVKNLAYKERMPNLPWLFADTDVSVYWRGLGRKKNVLSVTYDNLFTHSFSYYTENIGAKSNDYMVPDQFSHNLTISYSINSGRYNVSFECRNLTDARLYDNFSLQKAGRAFYGKVRVCFGD